MTAFLCVGVEIDLGGVQQEQSSRKEFKESRINGEKNNTNKQTKSLLIKTQLKRASGANKKSILVLGI